MVGLDVLRRSELFEGLADDELAAIARLAHEEVCDTGTRILVEGQAARHLYIVREGRVAILIDVGRGKQTVIDTVCRNGSFGWSAMVPPHIWSGSAQAMEKTRLVVIPAAELRQLCRASCATCYVIMEKIASIVSSRLQQTRMQLISVMYQ